MTMSSTADDGTVEVVQGRYVLRFQRRFDHPIDQVWEALTRPEHIREWFGEVEVELDLAEGGRYNVRTLGPPELVEAVAANAGSDQLAVHDTVLRVEPPTLFEHTFGGIAGSVVRWELRPDGDGCQLTLTHTEPPDFDPANRARDLAGWHTVFELMEAALAGQPIPWTVERWESHRDRYAQKEEA